ncbi:MAG: S46 family peptidase [Bacteroidia bacterium]|nr:S46 family peptidase [Bacteroidia bacterium]
MRKKFFIYLVLIISSFRLLADEGMWIPLLLEKYKFKDMQEKGLKLSVEDIYSINSTSLKDAIVQFGGGCTGEIISDQGLVITNHHCGYYYIQMHSSLNNDYLTNGFWAMSKEEELVNPGLSVTFLIRMENVTAQVLINVSDTLNELFRQRIINENINKLISEAIKGTHYSAKIIPFFYGKEYYMFVNEEFKDIRLVGSPPSAIGKFGGDTDNWMWPRHTGDFALFRIYADSNNQPAEYNINNVPYKPKKYLSVSLKGIKEGDFTMVYGYPGTTTEYLTSDAVHFITEIENPHQINLREKKLEILNADMENDPEINLKYSAKYASTANYWKKWIGESRGLRLIDAIDIKKEKEEFFRKWCDNDQDRKKKYGNVLPAIKELNGKIQPFVLIMDYIYEAVYAIEIINIVRQLSKYIEEISLEQSIDKSGEKIEQMKAKVKALYKNINLATDKKIYAKLLKIYYDNIEKQWHPEIFETIEKKFDGNFNSYAEYLYSKSVFADEQKMYKIIDMGKKGLQKFKKDPVYQFYNDISSLIGGCNFALNLYEPELNCLYRRYISGLMEIYNDSIFYPDANSTLRITYGQISKYSPRDGIGYDYFTTLDGIIEKDDPDIYDYKVPEKLKQLYYNKDYEPYSDNGIMNVCFIASNHTTGGNSGSPVLNANGELIGINFDRNWEGTMSDIMYNPKQCRNIALDIRYVLFIIDKFAGAKHLINEMKISGN